jgi:hypothetical protein
VDYQSDIPDWIWMRSRGHPTSVDHFPRKSAIIFLGEIDGRTVGVTSAREEASIASHSIQQANQDSSPNDPLKVFSALFVRMVSRLLDPIILLNFCHANGMWGTHLRVNFLKPSF